MAKLTKEQRDELVKLPVFKKINKLVSGVYLVNSIAMSWVDEVEFDLRDLGLRSGSIKSKIDNLNKSFDAFVTAFEKLMNVDARHYFAEDYESVGKALRAYVDGNDETEDEQKTEQQDEIKES